MYFIRPSDPNPITPLKAALLLLLCAVWLLTGLLGHDPWKPEEATNFGIVYAMLESGNWLVPMVAGEPVMDKPPLFFWTAALFAQLFSPVLPLHDGARLACGFYVGLALLFVGLAGRRLYGENRGWAAVIILIGCVALLVRAHLLSADLALLAGCAMMLYGFALSQEKVLPAGICIGSGAGIGFLAKGLLAPLLLLLLAVSLPLLFKNWRMREYYRSVSLAVLCCLPWLLIWPLWLYSSAPALFDEWLWQRNLAVWWAYVVQGLHGDSFYYLKNLPWLAWPAFPLACWGVWQSRHRLALRDDLHLPLVCLLVMLLALSLAPNVKEVYALPMLLPTVLLATAALNVLRRGAAKALEWFGIMTFALMAIAMWWGWAGLLQDNRAKITRWLKAYQPGFEPQFDGVAFVLALFASVLWLLLVWRISPSMRRAVLNWAGGMTLIWVLAMTLWLPWLESGKSYRTVVVSIKQALPANYQCVTGENLGDGQRAMLHYFGNIVTRKDGVCDIRLIQSNKQSALQVDAAQWRQIWEGGRLGDKVEHYYLYQRL